YGTIWAGRSNANTVTKAITTSKKLLLDDETFWRTARREPAGTWSYSMTELFGERPGVSRPVRTPTGRLTLARSAFDFFGRCTNVPPTRRTRCIAASAALRPFPACARSLGSNAGAARAAPH